CMSALPNCRSSMGDLPGPDRDNRASYRPLPGPATPQSTGPEGSRDEGSPSDSRRPAAVLRLDLNLLREGDDRPRGQPRDMGGELAVDRGEEVVGDDPLRHRADVDSIRQEEVV